MHILIAMIFTGGNSEGGSISGEVRKNGRAEEKKNRSLNVGADLCVCPGTEEQK